MNEILFRPHSILLWGPTATLNGRPNDIRYLGLSGEEVYTYRLLYLKTGGDFDRMGGKHYRERRFGMLKRKK